ncbi:hypothetical protein HELRODRAFT_177442 [Helobdella robusta]|uniref:Uncharacterized protein n=1 Tax=Helobdella robusta TaxID=6412 RepID=T1FBP8_HELRO|nr:hypothetical protein HELRODRAFT_177442 [Helobdella robusta]ESN98193.1 hypothetical protein HELRODRAFT_177442 [Helobdella robusta]
MDEWTSKLMKENNNNNYVGQVRAGSPPIRSQMCQPRDSGVQGGRVHKRFRAIEIVSFSNQRPSLNFKKMRTQTCLSGVAIKLNYRSHLGIGIEIPKYIQCSFSLLERRTLHGGCTCVFFGACNQVLIYEKSNPIELFPCIIVSLNLSEFDFRTNKLEWPFNDVSPCSSVE